MVRPFCVFDDSCLSDDTTSMRRSCGIMLYGTWGAHVARSIKIVLMWPLSSILRVGNRSNFTEKGLNVRRSIFCMLRRTLSWPKLLRSWRVRPGHRRPCRSVQTLRWFKLYFHCPPRAAVG